MGPKELEEIEIGVVRRQFDGIKFLWQTPETRYLLKLIIALFGFMIIYYGILIILMPILKMTPFLPLLADIYIAGELLFFGWFLFILIELVWFYWNDKKYKLFPEKNPRLKMKYWSSTKSIGYKRHLFFIILFGSLFLISVLSHLFISVYIVITDLIYIFSSFFSIFYIFILFITAFIAVKGIMKTFEEKYVEKLIRQKYWFFVLFPIPWIIFIISYSLWTIRFDLLDIFEISTVVNVEVALLFYGFMGILGLLALLKQDRRVSYTASLISASYTFLFVILIPTLMGLVFNLLGLIVSFLALIFLFIQGTLDKHGDDLRKYYIAWNKKLKQFHIDSEEDIWNHTYDRKFDTTPLDTDVPNAYRNSILGLALILVICYGIISDTGNTYAILGMEFGAKHIEYILMCSMIEIYGILLSLFIYVIVIGFRKQTSTTEKPMTKSD